MTHTSTEQERAEFEAWVEEYGLSTEPNYNQHTSADCWAAWQAVFRALLAEVSAPAAQGVGATAVAQTTAAAVESRQDTPKPAL